MIMYDIDKLVDQALADGFAAAGELKIEALEFLPEVRAMCSSDKCNSYGKNWSCPPACGTLEESSEKARQYSFGIIVQTIGQLEDDFDYETIMETAQKHKENFSNLIKKVKSQYKDVLPMSAGACTICSTCTYPDSPCRFPEDSMVSMEAYGLFVNSVCEKSGMKYNNGKNTTTFTSCYLLK